MAEYRTVRMGFWHDPYIEGLEAREKLLYLYLFTGPYANNLGIVEATRRKIAFETALALPEVETALAAFEARGKVVCDPEKNLIFVTTFIRHQTSTSPKILQSLRQLTGRIPSAVIARALCIRYPHVYGLELSGVDTVTIPYGNGMYSLEIPVAEFGTWKGEEEEEREKDAGNAPGRNANTPGAALNRGREPDYGHSEIPDLAESDRPGRCTPGRCTSGQSKQDREKQP